MFGLFKKDKLKEPFVVDELGEWLIISNNPKLSLLHKLINKAINKSGVKIYDLYIVHFFEDNELKNLFSVKGLVMTKGILREEEFANRITKILSEYGLLGEVESSKLRFCSTNYLFFKFDILLKKIKKSKELVKVLLPPLGVTSKKIPYSPTELFKDIFENGSNANCSINVDLKDDKNVKIDAICSDAIDLEKLKYSLSYFTKDFTINVKYSGLRNLEIHILPKDFNKFALIPLLWNNFLESYVSS